MAQVKVFGLRSTLDPVRAVLSDAIHRAVMEALAYPPEKRFHRFFGFNDGDFFYPSDRSDVIIRRETRAISGGDGIVDLLVGFPVPGQEFMEAWIGDVVDPCQGIGKPCVGIDIVQACGDDQGIHRGGTLSATV